MGTPNTFLRSSTLDLLWQEECITFYPTAVLDTHSLLNMGMDPEEQGQKHTRICSWQSWGSGRGAL